MVSRTGVTECSKEITKFGIVTVATKFYGFESTLGLAIWQEDLCTAEILFLTVTVLIG